MGRNSNTEKITAEEVIKLYETGMSQSAVAKVLGIHRRTVKSMFDSVSYKPRPQKMEYHGSWKGGAIMRNGYPFKRVKGHPRANSCGYVALHLLVMEKHLGKHIEGRQPIHHIDFDKKNCDISNLYLCKDVREHSNAHYSLEYAARELFHKGLIYFKDGKYYVK